MTYEITLNNNEKYIVAGNQQWSGRNLETKYTWELKKRNVVYIMNQTTRCFEKFTVKDVKVLDK